MATTRPVIAHVLHRLVRAGAEVLAADLARKMRDRFDFVFLCLDQTGPLGDELAADGFAVIDLKRRPGVDWSVARRIGRARREHGIALLHAHQYTPFFYAAASRGPMGLLGAGPMVLFTEHGRHYPDYRRPKRVLANRLLLRRSDRVTAVGQFVKQALVDNEGIAADRIEVIYNGIDPARFTPPGDAAPDPGIDTDTDAAPRRPAARAAMGAADGQRVILQVARFHPVKDHATAVRALAQVAEAMPEAMLVLVGDGDERANIESLAESLGVAGHVRFLGVRNDVAELMTGADVFLLSSVSEGISVTLLEAMGAALPIAATDVGGNAEVVAHGRSGLLSPRGDADALASNVLTLLRDPALRRQMGLAGRQRLLEQFTESRMHEQFARLYARMLAGA